MTTKTGTLDGKAVNYSPNTEFLVQVAKGRGRYATRFRVVGNLSQAVSLFNGINIGNGYRKRLLMPNAKRQTLARATS